MKKLRLFLTCLALVTACAAANPEKETTKAVVLSTQAIPKGKRIVGLRLEIYTARVRSFPEIPLDWHIFLELDGSYRATVAGNCQHGVGGLTSAKGLDRLITASASDWSEVRVEGVLFVTADFESSQEIKIDSSKVDFIEIK
jgi:hypothetical protein